MRTNRALLLTLPLCLFGTGVHSQDMDADIQAGWDALRSLDAFSMTMQESFEAGQWATYQAAKCQDQWMLVGEWGVLYTDQHYALHLDHASRQVVYKHHPATHANAETAFEQVFHMLALADDVVLVSDDPDGKVYRASCRYGDIASMEVTLDAEFKYVRGFSARFRARSQGTYRVEVIQFQTKCDEEGVMDIGSYVTFLPSGALAMAEGYRDYFMQNSKQR